MTIGKVRTAVVLATFALATAAVAEPATTTWTTYLYQGPGKHYAVLEEVPQATAIDVGRCADGWCRVIDGDRVGYLQTDIIARNGAPPVKDVLAQPAAALQADPSDKCFRATLTGGNGGKEKTIFCQKR